MQSMARLAVPRDREGRSVVTDHGLRRTHPEMRRAIDARRSPTGAADGSAWATDAFERVAWLALMPVYVALAVIVTIAYAVAVFVVNARS
jgi:hypothetical protein